MYERIFDYLGDLPDAFYPLLLENCSEEISFTLEMSRLPCNTVAGTVFDILLPKFYRRSSDFWTA